MSTLASALVLNKTNDVLNLEKGAAERIQTNFDLTFKNFRAVASFVDTFVTTTAGLFALYVPYTGATRNVNLGAYGVSAGYWHGTAVGLAYGGTNADLSATGGTGKVLRQSSLGAAITVATLASTELSDTSVIVRTSGSYADPSWLTSLQANKIIGTGTLADTVLSANIARLNAANSFSAQQSINNAGLQMLFYGYASVTGVVSTSNGEIRIGNATNDNLRLQYEGVTNHFAYIDHLYNNAAARLYFRMKASLASPINAMILDAAGNVTMLGGLTAGSGAVGIVDATGKVPAISSTYFASVSGAALTGITATQVGLGNVLNVAQEPALGNPASDGYVLSSTALGVRSWIAAAGAPHALLDGTYNNDTLAAGPTRGDLIVANSTPIWARFAVGAAGTFLQGGTDPAWAKIPAISSTYFTSLSGANLTTLTAANISAGTAGIDISGNAATATKWGTARNLAGNSVDGSGNVAFANKFVVQGTADTGLSGPQFLGALATGIVKNTVTTGVLSIAVAADFPTLNQSTTGSAATLTTPRAIYGNNFDGSAALTQIIASTYGGTGNGFTKLSGPTTSEKTKTLRDATDTILELGGSYTPTATWNWTSATATWPTFNQNTTGSAAKLTTPRTIAGVSFDGSANIAIPSSGLSDGTNLALLNAANLFTTNQTITKTTEQLRLRYDASDYATFTISSIGGLAIAVGGTNPGISLTPTGTGQTRLNGRIGINAVSPGYAGVNVGGLITSDGSSSVAIGVLYNPALNTAVGDTSWVSTVAYTPDTITTAGAGEVYAQISALRVGLPPIAKGAGDTVTVAATILIDGVPTAGVSNYALYATAGNVRFGGYGAGAATFDALGNISAVSDEQFKTKIRQFTRGLADLRGIQPITHKYTRESGIDTVEDYTQFSAQNVRKSIPEAVYEKVEKDKDGKVISSSLSFYDRAILATLVNAANEIADRLVGLEARVH